MSRRLIGGLVAVAGLVLLFGAALWLFLEPAERVQLPLVEGCPLHLQACSAELPNGGKITFEMEPKKPVPTEAIQLVATFEGVEPESVQVSFEGKEMYMGYLRYPLRAQLNPSGQLQFVGRGSLSICVRALMEWIAKVEIRTSEASYEIPFEFETLHQPLSVTQ